MGIGTGPAGRKLAAVIVAGGLLMGCSSGWVKIAPVLPDRYQALGPASATACGSMLLGPTSTEFLPIRLNDRVERAYQDALASVPGATALTHVTMQDSWFWWIIGTAQCTTISGTAIR